MYFFISSRMQAILQTDNVTACERGLLGRKKRAILWVLLLPVVTQFHYPLVAMIQM